jgi:serine protease Do
MRNPLLVVIVVSMYCGRSIVADAANWDEVLGPSHGQLPDPLTKVLWRGDLTAALREAKEQNRPVLLTLRCLPCKQCSGFDQNVLEGGDVITPLLQQFVTVRLTSASDLDLKMLPVEGFQDLDLSWWGYFLSPDARVYGVFGGRDHVSDETRISVDALANSLRRVLAHHYDPRRVKWDIDDPAPRTDDDPLTPADLPGYRSWMSGAHEEVKKQTCIHCHQVADILRQPAIDAKTFDKRRDTQVWPLPENVGITLDRDHGLLVRRIEPKSAADSAGMKPGDVLGMAGGRRLFGQADFRGVLHRAPHCETVVPIAWLRDGTVTTGELALKEGWRTTSADWRMSISQGNIGGDPTFFPLGASKNERTRAAVGPGAMAVKPYWGNEPILASRAGLAKNDIITAVNGHSPNVSGRAFLVWFRMNFEPGDRVTLDVVDPAGRKRQITYVAP